MSLCSLCEGVGPWLDSNVEQWKVGDSELMNTRYDEGAPARDPAYDQAYQSSGPKKCYLHHPDTESLQTAANNGCPLCQMLERCIYESMDLDGLTGMRPISRLYFQMLDWDEKNDFRRSPQLAYLWCKWDLELKLDVYQDVDSASLWPRCQHLGSNPLSHSTQAIIRNWIGVCVEKHERCGRFNGTGFAPTRLIDVGTEDGLKDPSLMITEHLGNGHQFIYATLSHCWGSTPHLKTTTDTLLQHQKSIPISSLNKTFQDAVKVTRRLGLQYLWIDSLCIIQDQESDWQAESSKMATIYKSAFINIAASSSSNGSDGFLKERHPSCKLPLPSKPGDPATYKHLYLRPKSRPPSAKGGSHLAERAWCLQEDIMAPRTLYYSTNETFFRCQKPGHESSYLLERGSCTSVTADRITDPHFGFRLRLGEGDRYAWYYMLQNYSGRRLTFKKDRLPGVAGLAGEWAGVLGGGYVAGLWEEDLLMGLCWYPDSGRGKMRGYIAPSWSWASQDTSVFWWMADPVSVERGDPERVEWDAAFISSRMDCVAGPYGQVTGGSLKMRGKMLGPIVLRWDKNEQVEAISGDYRVSQFTPDDEINGGGASFALLLGIHEHLGSILLFLEETGDNADTYTRVGCWHSTSYKHMHDVWAEVQRTQFTLV